MEDLTVNHFPMYYIYSLSILTLFFSIFINFTNPANADLTISDNHTTHLSQDHPPAEPEPFQLAYAPSIHSQALVSQLVLEQVPNLPTPTPTPTPRDFDSLQRSFSHCVEAGELYQTFKNGVNHADSSLIRLELSAPPDAPLPKPEVVDCNRDGSPDILIPSSLSDGSPAILRVLENACRNSGPPRCGVLELKAQGRLL